MGTNHQITMKSVFLAVIAVFLAVVSAGAPVDEEVSMSAPPAAKEMRFQEVQAKAPNAGMTESEKLAIMQDEKELSSVFSSVLSSILTNILTKSADVLKEKGLV